MKGKFRAVGRVKEPTKYGATPGNQLEPEPSHYHPSGRKLKFGVEPTGAVTLGRGTQPPPELQGCREGPRK